VIEVVGAQISSYWAHGWLEVPELKWVQTSDYKFHTFRSVHFHPAYLPDLLPIFLGSGSDTKLDQPIINYSLALH